MINYGVVYPQSILIFVVTMLYSVIQPIILIFGAVYFGCSYLVYKYKLLFGTFIPVYDLLHDIDIITLQCSISHTNLKAKHGRSLSRA